MPHSDIPFSSSQQLLAQPLRVFISSSMREMKEEREAIKKSLKDKHIAWIYEEDAGAQSRPAREVYLDTLARCDLYVGVFGKRYGHYTREEYDYATDKGIPTFLYIKEVENEASRDEDLRRFLAREGDIDIGNSLFIYRSIAELTHQIDKDIARWQSKQLALYERHHTTTNSSELGQRSFNELRKLIEKVDRIWGGVWHDALGKFSVIPISLEEENEVVDNPLDEMIVIQKDGAKELRLQYHIEHVFNEADKTLLILGEPGSGKSMAMLYLLQRLIAEINRTLELDLSLNKNVLPPIPVVFNLSSWSEHQGSLMDWLKAEMRLRYRFPRRFIEEWLQENRLHLFLDGLDEVREDVRPACVAAINEFIEIHSVPGMVVCCRHKEYIELPERLRFGGAILLKPLQQEQIDSYLEKARGSFDALDAALRQNKVLGEMAQTPLMLNVMCHVFDGASLDDIIPQYDLSREGHHERLFDKYTLTMYERVPKPKRRYTWEETMQWMGWLASSMQTHSKTLFQLEEMQPGWLKQGAQRWLYAFQSRSLGGLLLGVAFGLGFGLLFDLYFEYTSLIDELLFGLLLGLLFGAVATLLDIRFLNKPSQSAPISTRREPVTDTSALRTEEEKQPLSKPTKREVFYTLLYVIIMCTISGLFVWSFNSVQETFVGIFVGFISGLFFGLHSKLQDMDNDIRPIDTLGWSIRDALRIGWRSALWGGAAGSLLSLPLLFLFFQDNNLWSQFFYVALWGGIGTILGLVFGFVFGGIQKKTSKRVYFNQGILQTFRNLALVGSLVAVPATIIMSYFNGIQPGLSAGLFLALFVALWNGGLIVIQHYVLRILLHFQGYFPFRCKSLLQFNERLIFVQRVGGGYKFYHNALRDYLARRYAQSIEVEETV